MDEVKKPRGIRRSIYVPGQLAEELFAVLRPAEFGNFNRFIRTLLKEFIVSRKREALKTSYVEMAVDAGVRRECREIDREFAGYETDGFE
jgi:hypothetical protein